MLEIVEEIKKRYNNIEEKPDDFNKIITANSDISRIGLLPILIKKHIGITVDEFLKKEGITK